ncbi:FixH family protein [Devosia sp.]|uniref:FixH family protein n=1 Tax=Devosia sp. TaxID=1871048 RepID=UPI003A8F121A
MSTLRPARSREFTGRHMLVLVLGFFGVIIAVNATMAVLSSTSWTGLVVPNTYVASQEFEDKRIAHERQQAAGWVGTLNYDGARIELRLVDGTGRAVPLDDVTLQINRPVGGHDDQMLELVPTSSGSHAAPLTLETGLWEALARAPETELGPYELHTRFTVTGNGQ